MLGLVLLRAGALGVMLGLFLMPQTNIAAAPCPGWRFAYAALLFLEASHASRSASFQRVQPGVRVTGAGKLGSDFAQRQGVERWTP